MARPRPLRPRPRPPPPRLERVLPLTRRPPPPRGGPPPPPVGRFPSRGRGAAPRRGGGPPKGGCLSGGGGGRGVGVMAPRNAPGTAGMTGPHRVLILGAGPGLGAAIARRFGREGFA